MVFIWFDLSEIVVVWMMEVGRRGKDIVEVKIRDGVEEEEQYRLKIQRCESKGSVVGICGEFKLLGGIQVEVVYRYLENYAWNFRKEIW